MNDFTINISVIVLNIPYLNFTSAEDDQSNDFLI